MEFHERLGRLRRQRGLSQEELAEVVGVTRQAVQKWESGVSRPDMDNLILLARYFGVTLDWLVLGQEPSAQEEPVVIHHYDRRWEYEYKSKRTLWGLPLVHIHLCDRGFARARGIVAIGNVATGLVSAGIFSAGLVSAGVLSAGLLMAVGCVAAGLLSLGGLALGLAALGGIAVGWLGMGGLVWGVYGAGGVVMASEIAVGGVVQARLAIGSVAEGAKAIGITPGEPLDAVAREAIRQAVAEALGGRHGWLGRLLCAWVM